MALSAADIIEIQNLYSDYNFAIDFGDAEAWAACFTPDGSLHSGFGEPTTGTDALVEFGAGTHAMLPGARHQVANLAIRGDGDEATGRCYLQMYNTAGGAAETALVISGVYEDRLVRHEGAWRFAERVMSPDA